MANETIRYEDLYDASLEAGIKRLQKESDTLYESFKKTLLLQNESKIVTKDAANSSKELADAQSNLLRIEKENEKLKQKLISIEQKKAQETNKLTIEYQKQALEQRKQIELLKAQAQVQTSASNTEQKAQAIIKLLTIEKAKLNQETENGRKRLEAYNRAIDIQRQKLLSTGSVIQKQAMNVGNYAYNQNALNFSFAQLTREMPAFANSIQTGFMALSNNIPMFIDNISAAKRGIEQMRAEGQKAPSMFSVLAKSIFSFNSLISISITLLTIYGKDIVSWIIGMDNGKKKLEELKKAQSEYNSELLKGIKDWQKISASGLFFNNPSTSKDIDDLIGNLGRAREMFLNGIVWDEETQEFVSTGVKKNIETLNEQERQIYNTFTSEIIRLNLRKEKLLQEEKDKANKEKIKKNKMLI